MKTAQNPNANKWVLPIGYKDIGWQLPGDHDALMRCRCLNHKTREFDNSMFLMRCTDVVTICDQCKHVYHADMSD